MRPRWSSRLSPPLSPPPSDLLAVQHLPEWPAAPLLIRRLVAQLNTERGLRHQSGGGGGSGSAEVRLVNIDLLGGVTAGFTI